MFYRVVQLSIVVRRSGLPTVMCACLLVCDLFLFSVVYGFFFYVLVFVLLCFSLGFAFD